MKRLLIAAVAAMVFLSLTPQKADAREGFLIKGGVNYTSLNLNDLKGYTGFNAGIGYQSKVGLGFSIQPELNYSLKGTQIDENTNWKRSYVDIPFNFQWGPDLVLFRPYIEASPFIGFNVANASSIDANGDTSSQEVIDYLNENAKKVEYGLGLGGGIELFSFQLSVKYIWCFGPIANNDSTVSENISNISSSSVSGIEVSLAFIF
ncbi:MAG: porin family protein [Bacteroidales bacterium]|jgi:hypothetical protein|nr:porin family protein [Bacteroidales bacterium]MCI2121114.1 porin family protein [Bacteroidales bacterium]MCI2144929.1 porin family protein [Bacteroidales bacterium]